MKTFTSLFLFGIFSLSFLTIKADRYFIDLTQYDAVNSSNVTVANNGNGSVTLSLTDPEQTGYVLFNSMKDFSMYEKVYFGFQTAEAPSGAFTYTLATQEGIPLFNNSTEKGTYRPYSSASGNGDLDIARIAAEGGDVADCYFAVIVEPTSFTVTVSNAYAYTSPTLPINSTDIQTLLFYTHTDTEYVITSAPRNISTFGFSGWTSGNKDIYGDPNNWNRIPGKYVNLTAFKQLRIQITSPAEMVGDTFRLRLGSIPPVIPENPENYGGTYTASSKYIPVHLTGGTQVIAVDLTPVSDYTGYLSLIRFMEPFSNSVAGISLDVDYVVLLTTPVGIDKLPIIDKNEKGNVYNLLGMLVMENTTISKAMSTLPRGLYIHNGKKFIIK